MAVKLLLAIYVIGIWTASNGSYTYIQNNLRSVRHMTLRPDNIEKENPCLIIIFPETGVRPIAYVNLGKLLQRASPLSLWIVIVNSHGSTLETSDMSPTVNDVISSMRTDAGIAGPLSVFLCAHGYSGYIIQEYADLNPEGIDGLILYGSHLQTRQFYGSFPVPVLTLSGELDGITRISKIAQLYQDLLEETTDDVMLMIKSPVIVLEGVNHESFIDEPLPGHLRSMDINTDGRQSQYREAIANITSAFIINTLGHLSNDTSAATQVLTGIINTEHIVQPFITLQRLTQDGSLKSRWVKYVQIWLSGIKRKEASRVQVDSYTFQRVEFVPRLFEDEEFRKVITFSRIIPPANSVYNASVPQAPRQINSRLIDSERLRYSLGLMDNKNSVLGRSCADMNYASYLTAYHTASRLARRRYDATNPGFIFEDDVELTSESSWEDSELQFSAIGREVHVRAYSWKTSFSGDTDGFKYCTLLPPTRALEWIYVDSLKM